MKILKKTGCFLIILLCFACGNFSKIEVGEVKEFTLKGFEDNALAIAITVPIENPTMHKIAITDIDFRVYMNNQYLGRVNSVEQIILPSNSSDKYNIDLKVRVANFFGAALTLMNLKSGQVINFRLEGTIDARSMLIKKTIEISEERKVVV